MVGIGMMLSSICETQQQAILGVFAIGYPLIMISGFATPVENMPHWLQIIAQASPLKHFLVIMQGSFVKAMPAVGCTRQCVADGGHRRGDGDGGDRDRQTQTAIAQAMLPKLMEEGRIFLVD